MPKFLDYDSLKAALQSLGVAEELAELLANEQLTRGNAHVERLSFIKIVRSFLRKIDEERVIPANRFYWMTPQQLADDACSQALQRIIAAGIDAKDVNLIMREAQIMIVEEIFTLLDNVTNYEGFPVDGFCLHALSGTTDEPDVLIDGLHEMVGELHAVEQSD